MPPEFQLGEDVKDDEEEVKEYPKTGSFFLILGYKSEN